MELKTVRMKIPEGANLILGHSHFVKTVEDLYEIIVTTVPQMRFGIAFNEASMARLIRVEGNDDELKNAAVHNAEALAAGHVFVIVIRDGYPINILSRVKDCQEVTRVFCSTANPLEVIVVETNQGCGVLGVVDGFSPAGIEQQSDVEKRHELLRKIGYKR